MECDTKTQNLVIDLQRRTEIREEVASSLCVTSQICFHYLVWSTFIHTREQSQSLNIRFHHQLAFLSATCSVLLEAGPQSQGQGWGQNLKTPCRSHKACQICTSTWLLPPRSAKERAQRAPQGMCWPLNEDTGLLRGWVWSKGRGLSSSSLGVWDVEQEQQSIRMGRTKAQWMHPAPPQAWFPPLFGAVHGKQQRK